MDYKLVDKYVSFVDDISYKYGYDSNIKHLLYLIVPAFVYKYTVHKEKLVLDTFSSVKIFISNDVDDRVYAYYSSIPYYEEDKVCTRKCIVINNYQKISLVQLFYNLVHEFNHAINSYQKEIVIKDSILYLRTGLCYSSYSTFDFSPIKKDDSYVLEEVLNTNQTEEIINYIKSGKDFSRDEFSATVYALNHETDENFSSSAYYLEKSLLNPILENRTFISTLNNLRITGDIENIEDWFDNIVGVKNSYSSLIRYLKRIMDLERKYSNQVLFKNRTIEKIKSLVRNVLDIINLFNQNCHYK